MLPIASMALAVAATATPRDNEEEDQSCGQLLVEIARILAVKPDLDTEARVALGASLEFHFIQLQRSKTRSAIVALARTAILKLDAGGGESRTAAILSKGPQIVAELGRVSTTEYQRLCGSASFAPACQSQSELAKYVMSLTAEIRHKSIVSKGDAPPAAIRIGD